MTRAGVVRVLIISVVAVTCGAATTGCAPRPLYDWGRYEEGLQASYIAHDDAKVWSSLDATVTAAERSGHRLPPGACAEYGFALYRRGECDRAIAYFEREEQAFPESKPLMDKLITKIRGKGSPEGQSSDGAETDGHEAPQ
jgi:hypothetical protein